MNSICNSYEQNVKKTNLILEQNDSDNEIDNNSFGDKLVESIVLNKNNLEEEVNNEKIIDEINNFKNKEEDFESIDNSLDNNLEKKKNSLNNNININNYNDNKNKEKNKDINITNINNYNFHTIKKENNINNYFTNNESIIKQSNNNEKNTNNNNGKKEQNNNDNILGEYNLSKAFKKNLVKKETEMIFDFENIELPKESQKGEFTEINCPYILDNKEQQLQEEKNGKLFRDKILQNFCGNKTSILNKNYNSNYLNFFDENTNETFSSGSDLVFKTCINLRSKKNDLDIVKIMAVLKSSNNHSWKDNLKSLVSSLVYNGYGLTKKFDIEEPDFPLYIFDERFENNIRDEINVLLKSYLYMSYRSGFVNLNSIGCGDYTSDCGWGCMLRCCQMILSKGLIQKKKHDYYKNKNQLIDNYCLDNMRRQILTLFNDNFLPAAEVKNNPDYKMFWKKYNNLTKTNSEYNSISEVIPPYSIHILTKLGKCAGEYTSDLKTIKIISQINIQLFKEDMNILTFECGYISRKKLITNFCEEYTDFNFSYLDTITYNGIDYIFKKGGLVFISFRWGLYNLDPMFYKVIPLLFKKFHNNLGFVSGKKNRAYYFIGIDGNNKLIFADPHYNQQITNDVDKDYQSYYTENLYLLDIKDMSSELILGIGIFNSVQFTQFFDDLKWFSDNLKELNIINLEKD